MAFEDKYGILELVAAQHPIEKRKKRVARSCGNISGQNTRKNVVKWIPQTLQAKLRQWVKITVQSSPKKASI